MKRSGRMGDVRPSRPDVLAGGAVPRSKTSFHFRGSGLEGGENGGLLMPTMSNLRRRKIQARQRKVENEKKREAKIAKKERNEKK